MRRPLIVLLLGCAVGYLCTTTLAHAHGERDLLCSIVRHQQQIHLEQAQLAARLAESRSAAADAIFALVDELRANDAVEPMVHLRAKFDRDSTVVEQKRQALLVKRQEAEVERYRLLCESPREGNAAAHRREAVRLYRLADCHRIGKLLALAELELAYRQELLTSVRELRAGSVATQQDLIRAERDVELAQLRVTHHRPRVEACIASGDADGKTTPK